MKHTAKMCPLRVTLIKIYIEKIITHIHERTGLNATLYHSIKCQLVIDPLAPGT